MRCCIRAKKQHRSCRIGLRCSTDWHDLPHQSIESRGHPGLGKVRCERIDANSMRRVLDRRHLRQTNYAVPGRNVIGDARLSNHPCDVDDGTWQGPIGVPPGSIVLSLGLGSPTDDLAAELLVRLLRARRVDARHFSPADLGGGLPPGADPDGVAIVFLVSAFPSPARDRTARLSEQIRALLPRAWLVRVFCPGVTRLPEPPQRLKEADQAVASLVQAIEMCGSRREADAVSAHPPPALEQVALSHDRPQLIAAER